MSIPSFAATTVFALNAALTLSAQSLQVVSLTHQTGDARRGAVRILADGVSGENVTLQQLIRRAYGLQEVQIFGPAWIATEGYSIEAKAASRLTPEQAALALQDLLVDQFKLKSHREKRDVLGYRLEVAETGAKLRDPKEEEAFNAALGGKAPFKEGMAGIFSNKDLPGFAERLSRGIGRLVVDATGISGRYWFQLEWVPDKGLAGGDGPSLRAAIQEQLGLKLVEGSVPAQVMVIDSAERP